MKSDRANHHLDHPRVHVPTGRDKRRNASLATCLGLLLWLGAPNSQALDWPHWRGPEGNGISKETGWAAQWPNEGPKQLWKAAVGQGYSSMSVARGRVYTMGNQGDKDTIYCFDAETGRPIWKHTYASKLDPKYYDGGTSATPTVEGDFVYTLGRFGDVFCLEAATGKVVWSRNVAKEEGLEIPTWGFASSVLIDGDAAIINVGSSGMALSKKDGKTLWLSGKGASGYATPMSFVDKGRKLYAVFGAKSVLAVEPKTGKVAWEYPWLTEYDVNAAQPIVSGTRMLLSSGYGTGGAVIDFGGAKPVEVWKSKEMHNQFNTCVLIDGFLYGISGQDGQKPDLRCVEFGTGKVMWKEPAAGFGSLLAADGKLVVLSDKGELMVAPATPKEFKPLSRAQVIGGKCWTTPVLANGRIYCRNSRGDLVCVEVKGTASVN